jgi:hypothetical protein
MKNYNGYLINVIMTIFISVIKVKKRINIVFFTYYQIFLLISTQINKGTFYNLTFIYNNLYVLYKYIILIKIISKV